MICECRWLCRWPVWMWSWLAYGNVKIMGFFNYQTEKIEGLRVDSNPKIFFHGTCRKICRGKEVTLTCTLVRGFHFVCWKVHNGVTKMVSMDSTVASQFKTFVFNVADSILNLSLPNSEVRLKEEFPPSEGLCYRYSLRGKKSLLEGCSVSVKNWYGNSVTQVSCFLVV